jgi:ABC-type sugar transport system permease subunit
MINRKKILPYLLVSPYLVHFFLFVAFPVAFSIVLTFHKWNIISPMEYTGLNNYIRLFNDKTFLKSIGNTLIFLVIHIPLQIIVALFLAEILNQKIKLRGIFRGAFFLPVIISGVVVTILWQQLYGYDTGLLNSY